MTFQRLTYLICDGPRCRPAQPEIAGPLGGAYLALPGTAPLAAQRRAAAAQGWAYDSAGNADLCPRCQSPHVCHWCALQGTDRPATRALQGRCRHGHVRTFHLCEADAAAATRVTRVCVACARDPDAAHRCPVEVTDAGPAGADCHPTGAPSAATAAEGAPEQP